MKYLRVVTAIVLTITFTLVGFLPGTNQGIALADTQGQPNILVIMGDDIGWFNPSIYNRGMMGYETPNIDSIAEDGILFTDFYGENSCTAGRAAFLTGQSPGRTGLTKVGLPGVDVGLQAKDPTLAELLKPLGYATGQFGKNHLGDLDKYLPTNHGFDEFYGNLYHLNAEEEPENEDYPPEGEYPAFDDNFRPRGVIHSYADNPIQPEACEEGTLTKPIIDVTDEDPNNPSEGQLVCDTGPLNKKRMETVDEEFLDGALDFISKAHYNDQPFFVWFNSTRMHVFTHLKDESVGVTGQGIEADGMVEHDGHVGVLLNKLEELGIQNNTIVVYTTDNGAEVFTWPDGGTTPFHNEKVTNWEGGFRVPAMIKWPFHIKRGVISNEIMSLQDLLPTLMAAVGVPDIKEQLLTNGYGTDEDGNPILIHLDGYNFLPYLLDPDKEKAPREEFYYLTDDAYPSALRFKDWKIIFAEQRAEGFDTWQEPYVNLRVPMILNLRRDPFEKAPTESDYYVDWRFRRTYLLGPAVAYMAQFLDTFRDFPPSQRPASFSVDQVVQELIEDLKNMALD
ncbi:arylsulfatase [Moorena producens JHB]|uniref:Arylsulfatase n=1 Tax=Moorena producens (strain JHB) TaxID=1454205 RepID=A0A1D9FY53_MOOP1|nr:arylsulfatase [Moorena producens]AOY80215.1 arylsulfatase [Moorena producens JHB]